MKSINLNLAYKHLEEAGKDLERARFLLDPNFKPIPEIKEKKYGKTQKRKY